MTDRSLLSEIDAIYQAATDPCRWHEFLELYSKRYPGAAIYLWIEDFKRAEVSVGFAHNADMDFVASYEKYYAATNPWTDVMLRRPTGSIHTADMLVAPEAFVRSEFHNDWVAKQGLSHESFGCNILNSGRHSVFFSPILPAGMASQPSDLVHLTTLFPHLQRAVQIYFQMAELRDRNRSMEVMLDQSRIGCAVVDSTMGIVFTNKAADRVFAANDGLAIRNGRIQCHSIMQSNSVDHLLWNCLQLAKGEGLGKNDAIAIRRPSGKRPYGLFALPIRGDSSEYRFSSDLSISPPAVGLFINDPSELAPDRKRLYQSAFRLTAAEARMAEAFVELVYVRDCSDRLQITEGSVRQYLKRLFLKTGTKSQAELMKALLLQAASGP